MANDGGTGLEWLVVAGGRGGPVLRSRHRTREAAVQRAVELRARASWSGPSEDATARVVRRDDAEVGHDGFVRWEREGRAS